MSTKKKIIAISIVIIMVVGTLFISVVYMGVYKVGVTSGHNDLTEYILRTTMRNSIKRHARYIEVPDSLDLSDREYASRYFGHYNAACLPCHGAPGREAAPWMIIYPEAPMLADEGAVDQWTDPELFLILKEGIKSTGMMALGPTHPDKDIWGVTALVRQLPEMTAEEYNAMELWFKKLQNQE